MWRLNLPLKPSWNSRAKSRFQCITRLFRNHLQIISLCITSQLKNVRRQGRHAMLASLFTIFFRIFPGLKGMMWKQGYQFLSKTYKEKDWKFMNYGYSHTDGLSGELSLDEMDEANRYCIQLYHHVAGTINLRNLRVLEVGSGRGGGADYIKRYLMPETVIGVDFSENAVAFCHQSYAVNGLSFEIGSAESLPFTDNSFDIVVNVETSHCYNSIDAFFGQVKRVLHEGGYLLFADFRAKAYVDILREQIHNSGLILIKETDITVNVVEALNQDSERKTSEINKQIAQVLGLDNECKSTGIKKVIHKQLVKLILEFSGTKGSKIYEGFQSGNTVYLSFVLQKHTG